MINNEVKEIILYDEWEFLSGEIPDVEPHIGEGGEFFICPYPLELEEPYFHKIFKQCKEEE